MLRFTTFIVIACIAILGCGQENKRPSPDVSDIKLENNLVDAISLLDTKSEDKKLIATKYPIFYNLYTEQILGITDTFSSGKLDSLNSIASLPYVLGLQDTIALGIGDTKALLKDFEQPIKLLKHYFPQYPSPSIYLCNSIFNYQLFLFTEGDRDAVGIGLDMFLKSYYNYKSIDPQNPSYSDYLTLHFDKEHIVSKTMTMIVDEMVGPSSGSKLIDQMVHNGKKLYLLQHLLPNTPDSIIMDYTASQYKWVIENEVGIWAFFNENKLIFESIPSKINKYLFASPNSPGMPEAAPGRTANYIGLKIIEQFLDKNPETSIAELFKMKDTNQIFQKSKYRPNRVN